MEESLRVNPYLRLVILTIFLIVLLFVIMNILAYFYLSDCSADDVRASDWIDDVDKTSGCLSPVARWIGLIATTTIGLLASWVVIKIYRNK